MTQNKNILLGDCSIPYVARTDDATLTYTVSVVVVAVVEYVCQWYVGHIGYVD